MELLDLHPFFVGQLWDEADPPYSAFGTLLVSSAVESFAEAYTPVLVAHLRARFDDEALLQLFANGLGPDSVRAVRDLPAVRAWIAADCPIHHHETLAPETTPM